METACSCCSRRLAPSRSLVPLYEVNVVKYEVDGVKPAPSGKGRARRVMVPHQSPDDLVDVDLLSEDDDLVSEEDLLSDDELDPEEESDEPGLSALADFL